MKVNYNSWESDILSSVLCNFKLLNCFDPLIQGVNQINKVMAEVLRIGQEIIKKIKGEIQEITSEIKKCESNIDSLKSEKSSTPTMQTVKKQVTDSYGNKKTVTETTPINQGVISRLNNEIAEKESQLNSLNYKLQRWQDTLVKVECEINSLWGRDEISYALNAVESYKSKYSKDIEYAKAAVKYADDCMRIYSNTRISDGDYKLPRIMSKKG